MSKIELFKLTVTVIDKYNEELEKGYPESYLLPNKSLLALDRKIDELLEKIENAGFMEEFEDFTLSAWLEEKIMNRKQKLIEETKHRGFGCATITTR